MPIYVCKPGWGSADPWKHGVPVYAYPFPMPDNENDNSGNGRGNGDTNINDGTGMNMNTNINMVNINANANVNNHVNSNLNHGNVGIQRNNYYNSEMGSGSGSGSNNPPHVVNAPLQHAQANVYADANDPHGNGNRTGIPMDIAPYVSNSNSGDGNGNENGNENENRRFHSRPSPSGSNSLSPPRQRRSERIAGIGRNANVNENVGSRIGAGVGRRMEQNFTPALLPIRRLRHSEVVLVDEVSVHYNKYWMRLLWPGTRGGVAGYIVLSGTNSNNVPNDRDRVREWKERLRGAVGGIEMEGLEVGEGGGGNNGEYGVDTLSLLNHGSNDGQEHPEHDEHEPTFEGRRNIGSDDNESIVNDLLRNDGESGDSDSHSRFVPRCESTGLYYPSTTTMQLLASYDDGIDSAPSVTSIADETEDDGAGEPVFCRICREGLHDVDYDFEMEGQGVPKTAPDPSNGLNPLVTSSEQRPGIGDTSHSQNVHMTSNHKIASQPPPVRAQQMNHPYAANPLLSPCECSGSMAFVHYLCIEQWRCRSHHPAAKNGLNCETCNASYTLPPPPSRPDVNEEEDWLEAMPPHVLAALRRPHLCWQVGAAIVRRRYLRPIAPVLTSPIVALYCRARRTLKKRGVSRRRWACSLCRRRARWKCVRCLRSYYCSRQCQNVSWHIVHKHVCYKPVRFWWSVVVYGLAFVYFLPGVLSYPIVYDLALSFLWLSFVVAGIIGGGIATILKKQMGFDIRGRGLEASVVLTTFWLASICWGLVWAFFGESNECKGVFNYELPFGLSSQTSPIAREDADIGIIPSIIRYFILQPAKSSLVHIDNVLLKLGPIATKWICTIDESDVENSSCLQLTRNANPDLMTSENGENCISDVNTVVKFWFLAICMHGMSHVLKSLDRNRRAAAAAARRPRPHQD